ncbi:NADH-ubiquinone oxidoreductase chain 4 [Lucilia cuprina]|nr:NADH-ubiquinone oxidoreductase chain 4 [Lucilia cuprina]
MAILTFRRIRLFMFYLFFEISLPILVGIFYLYKAHVEAPVSGSIILAGIILKLVGGVLVRLICLRQTDLKALIAYSSVAHIGIVLAGLITLTYIGICGSYTLIIAHGLCSSGLFCLANISYERTGRRRLLINKELLILYIYMLIVNTVKFFLEFILLEEVLFGNFYFYFYIVLIFVTSIILLIISPNLISILLGWDGLGLVSYCLVIYFQNVKSYNAGILTALSNRIGNLLLLLSGLTIFIAGLGANYEFDLKKIIALSTLRQLGLIIRILSIAL